MSDTATGGRRLPKLKPERMTIEWYKDGKWFGSSDEKRIGKFRQAAETFLMNTADRHYYPPEYQGLIRLSYSD